MCACSGKAVAITSACSRPSASSDAGSAARNVAQVSIEIRRHHPRRTREHCRTAATRPNAPSCSASRNDPHGCGASTWRRHSSATRAWAASNENRRRAAGCSTALSASSLLCACRVQRRHFVAATVREQRHLPRACLEPRAGQDVAAEPVVDHVGAPAQVVDERHHLRVTIGAEAGHHVLPPLERHPPRVEWDRGVRDACGCRDLRCDHRVVVSRRWVMVNGDCFIRPAPGAHQLEQDVARVVPAAQRHDDAVPVERQPTPYSLAEQRGVGVDDTFPRQPLGAAARDSTETCGSAPGRQVEHAARGSARIAWKGVSVAKKVAEAQEHGERRFVEIERRTETDRARESTSRPRCDSSRRCKRSAGIPMGRCGPSARRRPNAIRRTHRRTRDRAAKAGRSAWRRDLRG